MPTSSLLYIFGGIALSLSLSSLVAHSLVLYIDTRRNVPLGLDGFGVS
jgi:hypothetical protein